MGLYDEPCNMRFIKAHSKQAAVKVYKTQFKLEHNMFLSVKEI